MPTQSQIPWMLAALVLTAYTHCVWSHATEATVLHQQLRAEQQPLDNSRAMCENESACICKGATLAIGVEAPAPELSFLTTVCVDSIAEWLGCAANSPDRRPPRDYCTTPGSGKDLRAQLQRFLL